MCQVCFIAQDDRLLNTIGAALGQYTRRPVLHFSEPRPEAADDCFSLPTLLIVDLQFISPALAKRIEDISRNYPETLIVPIAPAESRIAVEELAHWGVDEIIFGAANSVQRQSVIERLQRRITVLDRIAALQENLRREMGENQIVAKSKPLRELMQQLPALAEATSTILITGETGAGKELIARALHYLGPRAGQPFVTVDCGAIPENLIENELFGHARGAYTTADTPAQGLIAEAEGGTLFLDEVEALSLNVQSKFLRFLQEHQIKPLGQAKYVRANVRVLAATNIDLEESVAKRAFRADLYYRLNVVPLFIPPLRKRKADLPALVKYFFLKHSRGVSSPLTLPSEVLQEWLAYDWPGNVRELENKVQAWLARQQCEEKDEPALFTRPSPLPLRPLAEVRQEALAQCERSYLQTLITHTRGNISAAARLAGIHRKNLAALLKKYALQPASFHR